MINVRKSALLKRASNKEEPTNPDAPVSEEGLSVSELEALHKKLAALRASDAQPKEEERKSVRALIAYAACDLGVNEEVVIALVKQHFEFDDISEMHEGHCDELVRFLENLDIKQFIN